MDYIFICKIPEVDIEIIYEYYGHFGFGSLISFKDYINSLEEDSCLNIKGFDRQYYIYKPINIYPYLFTEKEDKAIRIIQKKTVINGYGVLVIMDILV